MATDVRKCSCKHEEQDKIYGKSMRLMNEYSKGYRCTICGKEYITAEKKS